MTQIYSKIKVLTFWIFFIFSVSGVTIAFCFTQNQNSIWETRRLWAKTQRLILNYKVKLIDEFHQDAQMLVMNHQSALDIIVFESVYPKNPCWITKKELGEIPVFQIAIKKPQLLCTDRKNPCVLVSVLKEAKERLKVGRVLAIFPKGTRSKGEKMLKFQSGAKILSEKLNLKMQPVLIVGSAKILDTQKLEAKSETLKLIALPLADTNDANWLENTRKTMQECLEKERTSLTL